MNREAGKGPAQEWRKATRGLQKTHRAVPVLLGAAAGVLAWLAAGLAFDRGRVDSVMPKIVFATPEELAPQGCPAGATCFTAKAYYLPERRQIHLREDWSPESFDDLGILLHEFVHHLQTIGKIEFPCEREIELPAYRIQEAFYAAHDRDPKGHVPSQFTRFTRFSCALTE